MIAKVPVRTFEVPSSEADVIRINIAEPDLRADNLNLTTWTSSFILARQLHKLKVNFDDASTFPILELGAGTGLVGLTATALWGKRLVLTDLAGIVPGLRANADLNATPDSNDSNQTICGTLDWKNADDLVLEDGARFRASEGSKASMIFAADTIYDEEHPELLSNAILTWLSRASHARAILCYPLRVAYLDHIRDIWTILERAGLEAEIHGQEEADRKEWDDECLCEWVVFKWKDA